MSKVVDTIFRTVQSSLTITVGGGVVGEIVDGVIFGSW